MRKKDIQPETIKAVEVLLNLFDENERSVLKIIRNGRTISLAEQFVSRGGSCVPVAENPVVFRAKAAKIIDANKSLIELIDKFEKDSLFTKLIDPNNYNEISRSKTFSKKTDKKKASADAAQASIIKTISSTLGGNVIHQKELDYSAKGDNELRENMNKAKLDFKSLSEYKTISTETGDEDHTEDLPKPPNEKMDSEEFKKSVSDFNKQTEYLEKEDVRPVKFADKPSINLENVEDNENKQLLIHDGSLRKMDNLTGSESRSSSFSFADAFQRQSYDTLREKIILAEAIRDIQNLEFVDIREKLYRKLDPLFTENDRICQ